MLRNISIILAVGCLMLTAHQADAGDAILVIDSGVVRLCASAAPPGEKLDPQSLVGSRVWAGARSGDRREVTLQAMASHKSLVGVEGGDVGLMLAYSEATTFVALQEPSHDATQISDLVLRRAQALGSDADHARITKIAYVDLDKAPGIETVVEASSWPPPGSANKGRSLDFVGIFMLSESGKPLGELFNLRGREDQGAHYSREIIAIGKNPFDDGWDFLIEEKYVSGHADDADDDEAEDDDADDADADDADLGETEASGSPAEPTLFRWAKVKRYLDGEFVSRNRMHWIQW
jgi:hypothetical protein